MWKRSEAQSLHRFGDVAAAAVDEAGGLPDDLRIDIVVEGGVGPNPDRRLRALAGDLARRILEGERPAGARDGAFAATVRARTEAPPEPPDRIATSRITATTDPTPIRLENSPVVVVRSSSRTRAKLVRDLVKDAKTQLPDHGPGGVFVNTRGAETAAEEENQMLAEPAHHAVVWACVCSDGLPQQAAWRNDQPFDDRLVK